MRAAVAELRATAPEVIGAVSVDAAEGIVHAARDAEREPALAGKDRIQFPPAENPGGQTRLWSGQHVDARKLEIVGDVEHRKSMLVAGCEGIRGALIVRILGAGVVGDHRQALRKALLDGQLERLILAVAAWKSVRYGTDGRVNAALLGIVDRRDAGPRIVNGGVLLQCEVVVRPLIPDVGSRGHPAVPNLALQAETPGI